MKLPKKKNLILVIAAVLIFSSVIFFIYLTLKDIKVGAEQIFTDKEKVMLIEQETRELENFKKKYDEYKPNLEKIYQLFYDSKNPVEFIRFLENTGKDSDITTKISLVPYQSDDARSTAFQISARGKFLNILAFLEKLEKGPYLIRIQSFTGQKSPQEQAGAGVQPHVIESVLVIEAIGK